MAPTNNGDSRRRDRTTVEKIVELIAAGVVTPGEIAAELSKNTQTVHTNLSNMRKRGLVVRVGRARYGLPNGSARASSRELVPRNGVEIEAGETRVVTRELKNRLRTNARIADALDGLFPGGVRNVETRSLVDWIDITRELIA